MINAGIYKIFSKSDPTKYYIGRSKDIDRRIKAHFSLLSNNNHHSSKLQDHYNDNEDDLDYCIVCLCKRKKDQIKLEQSFINNKPYFNCSSNSKGGRPQNKYSDISANDVLNNNDKFELLCEGVNNNNINALIKWFELRYGKPKINRTLR